MNELFLESGSHVRLRLCRIPKATFLRLRAQGNEYLRWSNQKAVLETAIKEYATVTLDSNISLHFGGKSHTFRIVGLEPAPHANLIDTDVTVELEDDVPSDFGFSVDQTIPQDNTVSEVKSEEPDEEELSNIAQPAAETVEKPSKRRARRRRGEKEPEPEQTTTPTVQTFSGVGHSLSNTSAAPTAGNSSSPTPKSSTTVGNSTDPGEQPPNSVLCKFCRKFVPDYSYDRHEAFCSRNNYVCPLCDQNMPKSKEAEHHEQVHKEIPCPDCGNEMEPGLIASHLENSCTKRKIRCEFCMLNFTADEIFDHSSICGSRTERCKQCQNYVMLREFDLHSAHNCNPPAIYSQDPFDVKPSENYSVSDYTDGVDDLRFCPYCMAPFMDDNSLIEHMTSQLDVLVATIAMDDGTDLAPVLAHLGVITEPEDVRLVVNTALESTSEKDYLSILIENKTIQWDTALADNNKTLLHYAAEKDKSQAIESLLKFEAVNPNIVDKERNSPLHFACSNGATDCVRKLLKTNRASIRLQNAQGKNPLQCCLESELPKETKSSVLSVFIECADMLQFSIDKKYMLVIKEAMCDVLSRCYWGKTKDREQVETQLLNFLWRRNGKVINQVQKRFMKRIQNSSPIHMSAEVNSGSGCSLVDNLLRISLLNNGTIVTNANLVFPEIPGVEFEANKREVPLGVTDSHEFVVRVRFDDEHEPLGGSCLLVNCTSTDASKGLGSFYCLVPIQSDK